jgi:hypothetical protein
MVWKDYQPSLFWHKLRVTYGQIESRNWLLEATFSTAAPVESDHFLQLL